jgi:DNA-binding NarL/FixJ family response regulator
MEKISVMIVDRQEFFRVGVRQALADQADLDVSECAPDGNLVECIENKSPDVLLLDIDYPSLNGLELGRRITRNFPNTRVVMLTPNPDDEELFEVIKTGAVAYLNKNTSSDDLLNTIRHASNGEYPINDSLATRPKIAEHVLKQFQAIVAMGKTMEAITAPLTFRETQVLSYVAEGSQINK